MHAPFIPDPETAAPSEAPSDGQEGAAALAFLVGLILAGLAITFVWLSLREEWFFVCWAALIMLGWIPLAIFLRRRHAYPATTALSGLGGVWSLLMVLPVIFSAEPVGAVTPALLEQFALNVFAGAALGLIAARVFFVRRPITVPPPSLPWLLGSAALSGICFFPLVSWTGSLLPIAEVRYQLSGQAASDAAEAARPILPLKEQVLQAMPDLRERFPREEIVGASASSYQDPREKLASSVEEGLPRRWCLTIREPGQPGYKSLLLDNGRLRSNQAAASCSGVSLAPGSALISLSPAGEWAWVGAEEAVRQVSASPAGQALSGGAVSSLILKSDLDGRPKWLVVHSLGGNGVHRAMFDARDGTPLCSETADIMDRRSPTTCAFAPPP